MTVDPRWTKRSVVCCTVMQMTNICVLACIPLARLAVRLRCVCSSSCSTCFLRAGIALLVPHRQERGDAGCGQVEKVDCVSNVYQTADGNGDSTHKEYNDGAVEDVP